MESFNEYWLETEARLREDFNIADGYRPKEMSQYKRKSGMKAVYSAAGKYLSSVHLILFIISPSK